ncbi:hypothetical protein BaRGS_00011672 [Batillaria attramentaria]|uniref:AAA+ ATPase domain-containing protein n=1 Tax=Batillaria attramentaria TaxID=370345 RepID=A0ABD0LDT9_9CAEN
MARPFLTQYQDVPPKGREQVSKDQYKSLDRRRPASRTATSNGTSAKRTQRQPSSDEQIKTETSESWKKSVPEFFPELHRRAYFSPPTLFNRVAFETGEVAGEKVKVPIPSVQLSDVRENQAQFRVHYTFQQVFRDKAEPMVVVSNVIFDNYLNNPDGTPVISKDDQMAKSPHTSKKQTQIRSGDKSGTETHPKGHVLSLFKRPRDLSSELQRGTFDMLFISKKHGLIICDIKALGDAFGMEKNPMSEEKKHAIVKDKVMKALKQLEKEKQVLKYLTSDVKKEWAVAVTETWSQFRKRACRRQKFCQCFESETVKAALSRCLFSDSMPPTGLAWEVDDDVISRLYTEWWSGLVQEGQGQEMDDNAYESIVARFCGPATNLHAFTAFQSRADVTILHDAVLETASCMQLPTLTQDLVNVVTSQTDNRVYLTGPPGTGKSLTLKLKAMQWARQRHDVIVVSLWPGSDTASRILVQQIKDGLETPELKSRVRFIRGGSGNFEYILNELLSDTRGTSNLTRGTTGAGPHGKENCTNEVEMVDINGLNDAAEGGDKAKGNGSMTTDTMNGLKHEQLPNGHKFAPKSQQTKKSAVPCLIVDEAPWFFKRFVQHLEKSKPSLGELPLWAASSYYGQKPESFKEVRMTQSLRCPPVVVRELQKGAAYSTRATYRYATGDASVLASLPPPTDGPPVKRIRHTSTHEGKDSWNCGDCGREVATFLTQDLLIGKPDVMTKNTNQRRLKFSDVIVSGHIGFPTTTTLPESLAEEHMEVDSDDTVNPSAKTPTQDNRSTGFLQGLRNKDEVPLEIITKQDTSYAEKLSCPTEDKVQVAEAECILGTERPVVVVIGPRDMNATCPGYVDHWCDVTGTCVSQLVVVEMNDCFAKIQLG